MKKTLCTLLLFLCSGCSAVKVSTNINDVMIANQIAKHDLYKFRNHQHANEMGATMMGHIYPSHLKMRVSVGIKSDLGKTLIANNGYLPY